MLADAEDAPGGEDGIKGADDEGTEPPAEPPVRRKAKTKIGNKTKKKKKTKTTSKFLDGEESLEVELGNVHARAFRHLFVVKRCCEFAHFSFFFNQPSKYEFGEHEERIRLIVAWLCLTI